MNPRAVSILQLALNGRRRCPTHAQLSNAKWQQQKAWLSQWCKSQQTSGNVELLRVVEEGGKGLGKGGRGGTSLWWEREKPRWQQGRARGGWSWQGWRLREGSAGRRQGGCNGGMGVLKKSGSPDRESVDDAVCQVSILSAECLCSPQAAQHGPASFCALIHSHTMSSRSLLSPPPPASALDCTVVSATGIKNGLLCVCCFHAKLHLRFRIMQMAPNVSLRWSLSSLYYFCVNHNH